LSPKERLSLVRDDQRRRWRGGDRALVEGYLERWPALAEDTQGLLDLVYAEVLLREERGETPTLEEYLRRFPDQADSLKRQFALHRALADDHVLTGSADSASTPAAEAELKRLPCGNRNAESASLPETSSLKANSLQAFPETVNDRIGELLLLWEALRAEGRALSAEELCTDCPDLVEELRRLIEVLQAAPHAGDVLVVPETRAGTTPPRAAEKVGPVEKVPALSLPSKPPRVPGYELLGLLGKGGMGIVYKARQKNLNRLVALKTILAEAPAGSGQLARFRREAEAAACLQHPNVVQIYEVGEYDGRPYFALEFVSGGTLGQKLAGAPLPPREAARLLESLARVVHYAHQQGIVHRDLKPANVLLQRQDSRPGNPSETPGPSPFCVLQGEQFIPKITDFGLAKQIDQDSGQTRSGEILGTPAYMAPEQARGQGTAVGPLAYVFALGAMLYETLTGRPPFRGATVWDTIEQVLGQEPVPPSRLQPKLPRDLETICLKCLQKEPAKRYASAEALGDDLLRFQTGEPIRARPTSRLERVLKWARRRPAAAALVVVSVLAAAAVVAAGVVAYAKGVEDTRLATQRLKEVEKEYQNRRLEDLRQEFRQAIVAGEAALAARDWNQAKGLLSTALEKFGSEPSLEEEKQKALGARKVAQVEIDAEKEARDNYKKFKDLLQKALLYQSQVAASDRAKNVERVRSLAEQALALFGMDERGGWTPKLPKAYFSEEERNEITNGCYVLVLAWAEAMAQPLEVKGEKPAEQAEKALALLDRARTLRGTPTKAYCLRRASYLAKGNRELEAAEERRKADDLVMVDAVDYFLVGEEHYRRGELSRAIRAFASALQHQPRDFWAQYLTAICYLRLPAPGDLAGAGNFNAARASLIACAEMQPDFPWVYVMRGWAHGNLGERTLKEARRAPSVWRYFQLCAEARSHFQDAEEDFNHAAKLLKSDLDAAYVLAVNRGTVRLWTGDYAEAEAELKRAIKLQPEQFNAYVNLAQVYQEQKRFADALAQLDKALELAQKDPSRLQADSKARGKILASLYRTRAKVRLLPPKEEADTAGALADFELAIRADPDPLSLEKVADHVEKGRLLHGLERVLPVFGAKTTGVMGPLPGPNPFLTVSALMPERALGEYNAALHLQPDYPLAYRLRAVLLLERGHYKEAVGSLDEYLKRGSRPTEEIYRIRGLAREKLGDYGGAVEDLGRALAFQRDPAALIGRGRSYLAKGAPELALADFEEVIRGDQSNGKAHVGCGLALVKLGRHEDAAKAAEKAYEVGPRDPLLVYNSCRVFAQAVRAAETARTPVSTSDHYRERTLNLLREALGRAPRPAEFWKTNVQNDPALNPIRRAREFTLLEARYVSREGR
jgi:tetratricopeptide (TPR) repeat protein